MKIVKKEELTESFYQIPDLEELSLVKKIIRDVREKGDQALREYTKKFDSISIKNFELSEDEIRGAYSKVDNKIIESLKFAAKNIEDFSKKQLNSFKEFETDREGTILGQKIVPLKRVGCYVPGGRYPLPSTALMGVIPAKVAGVKEVLVCSPKIKHVTIVAADIAGADKIFNLGGVQAIAALAYGTESIEKVDKIVGPGNKYVGAAKKEVYGEVGIDLVAGPSEVLVVADESGNPEFIAADLLAQAEHDPDSKSDLVTTSKELAEEVKSHVEKQLEKLKTKEVAQQVIERSKIVIVDNLDEAVEIANRRAPEHLELEIENPHNIIGNLENYGSLFIGGYSAEVLGDYCSGPNHTLPTGGSARYTGGLSVRDFIKILTYQKVSKESSKKLIKHASRLAEVEGLEAHKKAADIRKEYSRKD